MSGNFTVELGDYIVARLWEGATLPQIEREWNAAHEPAIKINRQRTHQWGMQHPDWAPLYTQAMIEGGMALLEENVDIADDRTDDPASRKVRMDAREKLAARKDPLGCGTNRLQHTGAGGGPVETVTRIELVPGGHGKD